MINIEKKIITIIEQFMHKFFPFFIFYIGSLHIQFQPSCSLHTKYKSLFVFLYVRS